MDTMHGEKPNEARLVVRPASVSDYEAYSGLFPELMVDDPVPALEVWSSLLAPSTWIAARGDEVLGYCYVQEFEETGYIRNVVVAPAARRKGVGVALMSATAQQLRSHGKRSWRLNVRSSNVAALALYRRMGMHTKYVARSLRFPWVALKGLPKGSALVQEVEPDRDPALERAFELPRGQLAGARSAGRLLFEATTLDRGQSLGLAVFDPNFPGAFPFRVRALDAVAPLLTSMRRHTPADEHVNLVAEDDERLAELLMHAGATLRDEFVHLQGAL